MLDATPPASIIQLKKSEQTHLVGFIIPFLGNLYHYDYEAFRKQIDNSDINADTSSAMIECVLRMINVFDYSGDEHFLDLAEYLLDRLQEYVDAPVYTLNKLQIKKRIIGLQESDFETLNQIDGVSEEVDFGKSVLLGNKEEAMRHFNQLTPEMREQYSSFPIYKLYENL